MNPYRIHPRLMMASIAAVAALGAGSPQPWRIGLDGLRNDFWHPMGGPTPPHRTTWRTDEEKIRRAQEKRERKGKR